MVFDAHERAFAFFKGACTRGIYDNMKTAVEAVFVGKDRQFNRRFLQMCSHYPGRAVACTPASGWEKGQVENQVGLVRERFFTPRLRFKSLRGAERLAARQVRRLRQGASPSRAAGQDGLGDVRGGRAQPGALSRPLRRLPQRARLGVEDLPGALRQQQVLGASPRRSAGRSRSMPMPIASSSGRTARRRRACARLRTQPDGLRSLALRAGAGAQARRPAQRRAVQGLGAAAGDGAGAPQAEGLRRRRPADGRRSWRRCCATAWRPSRPPAGRRSTEGVCSAPTSILNILARRRDPAPPPPSSTPDRAAPAHEPVADCARYDSLQETPADGTHTDPRPDGHAEARRHAQRLRRDHGHRHQAPARAAEHRRRSAEGRDRREAGPLHQATS